MQLLKCKNEKEEQGNTCISKTKAKLRVEDEDEAPKGKDQGQGELTEAPFVVLLLDLTTIPLAFDI